VSARPRKHMILTTFMMAPGYHRDSWRLPESRVEEIANLKFIVELTRMAEAAKLDSIFFGDFVNADTALNGNLDKTGLYEPITTMAALAACTNHIGLSGTISTQFSLPYVTARQLQSIDWLSGGRVGWNVVTSAFGGENFGIHELPEPRDRYRQAAEFLDVALALWDSWSDEAVIADRESGTWVDTSKVRPINHRGEFFDVAGPLQAPRSPQGRPVIFQSGSSNGGKELGARYADAIYTAQPIQRDAIAFRKTISDLAVSFGRPADAIRVIPGVLPIVGETDAEAREMAQRLEDHIDFTVGKNVLAKKWDIELDDLDISEPVPAERWGDDPNKGGSRFQIVRARALEEGLTLRELIVTDYRSGGHFAAIGSASKVADQLVDWFEAGAADGFSLNPPSMPEGLRRIGELLVPELQNRGYFREEYEGTTLRENLGLARPGAWDTAA